MVPAELRFMAREVKVPDGDLMLELPDSILTWDWTVVRDGLEETPLEDLSFLEKIPMVAGVGVWLGVYASMCVSGEGIAGFAAILAVQRATSNRQTGDGQ